MPNTMSAAVISAEMNADDFVVDARLDGDARHGSHVAERLDLDRSLALDCGGYLDGDGTRTGCPISPT
jgi:hypothetical protein